MSNPSEPRFETDLLHFTIANERLNLLTDLITIAREDFLPRNFAERHLVDDLAISKWRMGRVAVMEKAVFERQRATYEPLDLKDEQGRAVMPHEDVYHLALVYGNKDPNSAESHAVILAALSRLDARYSRQFCTSLRLLIALRRGTPPPVTPSKVAKSKASPAKTTSPVRKENTTCEPSPITQPTM